ncbi:MAG: AI-2E family transporter [Clostridia bacterium]|nr:AI-2E family transporter [Clostridia bacterium]
MQDDPRDLEEPKNVPENGDDSVEFKKTAEGRKYRRIAVLVITIFAACLLMVLILFRFENIHSSITWIINSLRSILLGLGMAYILNPFDNQIRKGLFRLFMKSKKAEEKKASRRARRLSIGLTFLLGLGVVTSVLVLIIPSFVEGVRNLDFRDALQKIQNWLNARAGEDDLISVAVSKIIAAVNEFFTTGLSEYLATLSNYVISTGYQIITYVFDFLISFIVALYALLEKENFTRHAKKMLYAILKPKRANGVLDVCRHGNRVFGNYLSFKIVDCLLVGALLFLLLSIFKVPYAAPISIFCGVMNFIPYIGPFIGGVPSGLIILLVEPNKVIPFAIIFVALMILDANILTPWILGDRTGVSPFWIIFSLLFFRAVFGLFGDGLGIVGMIIAVPLFCVIDYFVSRFVNQRLEKRKIADCPFDYKDVGSIETAEMRGEVSDGSGEEAGSAQFVRVSDEEDSTTLWEQTKRAFSKLRPKNRKKKSKKS